MIIDTIDYSDGSLNTGSPSSGISRASSISEDSSKSVVIDPMLNKILRVMELTNSPEKAGKIVRDAIDTFQLLVDKTKITVTQSIVESIMSSSKDQSGFIAEVGELLKEWKGIKKDGGNTKDIGVSKRMMIFFLSFAHVYPFIKETVKVKIIRDRLSFIFQEFYPENKSDTDSLFSSHPSSRAGSP